MMDEEVKLAVQALKEGKTILYPTDTIWGLGCDPTNQVAVKNIFRIKGRDERKALILLISRIEQLRDYVVRIPDIAWDIVDYAEKPLTVIYPKGKNVCQELLAEDGSIGIRVVKDPFCQAVINKFGKGIVSTSANKSGHPSPSVFSTISSEILKEVDYTVNYKREDTKPGTASMLMKIELDGQIKILRK